MAKSKISRLIANHVKSYGISYLATTCCWDMQECVIIPFAKNNVVCVVIAAT